MSEWDLEEKIAGMLWEWEDSDELYREFAKRIIAEVRAFCELDNRE